MKTKIIALVLCTVLVFSLFAPAALASGLPVPPVSVSPGEGIQTICIPRNRRAELTSDLSDGADAEWQILHSSGWIPIAGETRPVCLFGYSMAHTMLDEHAAAHVRCVDAQGAVHARYDVTFSQPEIHAQTAAPEYTVLQQALPQPSGLIRKETAASKPAPESEPGSAPEASSESAASNANAPCENAPALESAAVSEPAFVSEPACTPDLTQKVENTAAETALTGAQTEHALSPDAPQKEAAAASDGSDIPQAVPSPDTACSALDVSANVRNETHTDTLQAPVKQSELPVIYEVRIKYIGENGGILMKPWTQVLEEGANLTRTVRFPVLQGYHPCLFSDNGTEIPGTPEQTEYTFNITDIRADYEIVVLYKPEPVSITVKHHFQMVLDDTYKIYTESDKKALAGTKLDISSLVLENTPTPDPHPLRGFETSWFEEPVVRADGSTVVDIYYDRNYYLLSFDLTDPVSAYGAEPIYARCGMPIDQSITPTRPGYIFKGWYDNTMQMESPLPAVIPPYNALFTALWAPEKTAKVTFVLWGERAPQYPNPTEPPAVPYDYEYLHTITLDKPYYDAPSDPSQNNIVHKEDIRTLVCSKPEHKHGPECYHSTPTDQNALNTYLDKNPDISNPPAHGTVVKYSYRILFFEQEETCIYDANRKGWFIKTRNADCGITEHIHDENACYGTIDDSPLWKFVCMDEGKQIQPGVNTFVNVFLERKTFTLRFHKKNSSASDYGVIESKWGSEISAEFAAKTQAADQAQTDKNVHVSSWSQKQDASSPWIGYVQIMPAENIDYYANAAHGTPHTAHYYKLKPNGDRTNKADYDTSAPLLVSTSYAEGGIFGSSLTVSEDDYLQFEGYTFNPDISTPVGSSFNGAEFYYYPSLHRIDFHNPDGAAEISADQLAAIEPHKIDEVPYHSLLAPFAHITPNYPSIYEPESYYFAGWYLSSSFAQGTEVLWDRYVMPNSNLTVYARWLPVVHRVRMYGSYEEMQQAQQADPSPDSAAGTLDGLLHNVTHNSLISDAAAVPDRESEKLQFMGWFFRDKDNQEHAFDPQHMPVKSDLDLYIRWKSNISVDFHVYYGTPAVDADGNPVLNEHNQPVTGEPLLDIAGNPICDEYGHPLIRVADDAAGKARGGVDKIITAKSGAELYLPFRSNFFPQAPSLTVPMQIGSSMNEVLFIYHYCTLPIPYTVYYKDALTGKNCAEPVYRSDNVQPVVVEDYLPIRGYLPDAFSKRLILSSDPSLNQITFYYRLDTKNAPVRYSLYTEQLDGSYKMHQAYEETVPFGTPCSFGVTIEESEKNLPGFSYNPDHPDNLESGTPTADGAPVHLKRYFSRKSYPYRVEYLLYGSNEPVPGAPPAISGTAPFEQEMTFTAPAIPEYKCISNELSQKMTVTIENTPQAQNNKIIFYYESLRPYFSLTINNICDQAAPNQNFIYRISGSMAATSGVDFTVTVPANGSTVIDQLPVGRYTVTEVSGWSWRYDPAPPQQVGTVVQNASVSCDFVHTLKKKGGLSAMDRVSNHFAVKPAAAAPQP